MLKVTCGPMFAGKSTAILRDSMDVDADNKLVVKPKNDTRNEGFITTHAGILIPAVEIDPSKGSIYNLVEDNKFITDVFIDEVQFFNQWIIRDIIRILFDLTPQINVHVYGLDLDYRIRPWPVMATLLPMADEVIKLKARCAVCDEPASKTIRTSNLEDLVVVGEGQHYEPRCNGHL